MEGNEAIRLGPLDDLIGYHLRRASAVVVADFGRAMAGTGLRQVLVAILSIIAANPGINQGNIGRSLGILRANMVSLITEIVEADLVVREVSLEDRRAFTFTLTDKGSEVLKNALTRIREHEEGILSNLTNDERDLLRSLLGRIEAQE